MSPGQRRIAVMASSVAPLRVSLLPCLTTTGGTLGTRPVPPRPPEARRVRFSRARLRQGRLCTSRDAGARGGRGSRQVGAALDRAVDPAEVPRASSCSCATRSSSRASAGSRVDMRWPGRRRRSASRGRDPGGRGADRDRARLTAGGCRVRRRGGRAPGAVARSPDGDARRPRADDTRRPRRALASRGAVSPRPTDRPAAR